MVYIIVLLIKKDAVRLIAANMESSVDNLKHNVDDKNLEEVHKFLCSYTVVFTNNIYSTKEYTYHNLHGKIQKKAL